MDIKGVIEEFPDFPKKGILFRDISPLLKSPAALSFILEEFEKKFHPKTIDLFAGIESRGFPLACAMASKYGKGMIMIRKQGKLPGKTIKTSYKIEYGKATMELQKSAIEKSQKVLICDDLLATGGTAAAAAKLIEKLGGIVAGFAFLIELTELNGIKPIQKYKCVSLVKY